MVVEQVEPVESMDYGDGGMPLPDSNSHLRPLPPKSGGAARRPRPPWPQRPGGDW